MCCAGTFAKYTVRSVEATARRGEGGESAGGSFEVLEAEGLSRIEVAEVLLDAVDEVEGADFKGTISSHAARTMR